MRASTRAATDRRHRLTLQDRADLDGAGQPDRLCRAGSAEGAEEALADRHRGGRARPALLHEDRERDVALPADEPGVGVRRVVVVLGGAGLAVDRPAGDVGEGLGGAGGDHLAHHRLAAPHRLRLQRRCPPRPAGRAPGPAPASAAPSDPRATAAVAPAMASGLTTVVPWPIARGGLLGGGAVGGDRAGEDVDAEVPRRLQAERAAGVASPSGPSFGASEAKAVLQDFAKSVLERHRAELEVVGVLERPAVHHERLRTVDRRVRGHRAPVEQAECADHLERRAGRHLGGEGEVLAGRAGPVGGGEHRAVADPDRHQGGPPLLARAAPRRRRSGWPLSRVVFSGWPASARAGTPGPIVTGGSGFTGSPGRRAWRDR